MGWPDVSARCSCWFQRLDSLAFDALLAGAGDRVGRPVHHFLAVLDELNHLDIELVSFRENIDRGGPLAAPSSSLLAPSPSRKATS
jgi:hypothetical protein